MMRILLMPDEPDKDQWRERNASMSANAIRAICARAGGQPLLDCRTADQHMGPTNMSGRSPAGTLQPENRLPDLDKSTGWPAPHLAKPS
jgi:hypothetical protein